MKPTYLGSEARRLLSRILREGKRRAPGAITRRGETVPFIVTRERMKSIVEALRFLLLSEAMSVIEANEKDPMPRLGVGPRRTSQGPTEEA